MSNEMLRVCYNSKHSNSGELGIIFWTLHSHLERSHRSQFHWAELFTSKMSNNHLCNLEHEVFRGRHYFL